MKTQIEKLKETGYYGSRKDPQYNKKTGKHDCCGSTRSFYHKKGCPLCRELE